MSSKSTVKVKLLSSRTGHRSNDKGEMCGTYTQSVGSVVSMPTDEAKRHVDNGLAEYTTEDTK